MKQVFLLTFIMVSFFANSIAQDALNNYNRAKTLLGYGNNKDAMELFRSYMDEKQYGDLSRYATFYFAQAAFMNKQPNLSKATLEPLLNLSNWDGQDDARYLMALIYFEEGNHANALERILEIKDETVKQQAENATYKYLKDVSLSYLAANLKKYETNRGFVVSLKEKIEKQSVMSTNDRLIYNQIKNVELGNSSSQVKNDFKKKDDVLDVAVVLPFSQSSGTQTRAINTSNFIFELYQGIAFALDEAKKKGLKVNVKAFDTQRSVDRMKGIFADPFFDKADIIIGPLYPEEVDLMSSFAEDRRIPFINPLSNIDDKVENFEYAYLFRPSVSAITDGVLAFARQEVRGRRIAIAYTSSTRDENLAKKLSDQASSKGFQVVSFEKVDDRSIRGFFEKVNLRRGGGAPSADMIVILTDDPNIAAPTFQLMESISRDIPVLVMDSWLYFNFANYEMIQHDNFHFISNNTAKFGSKELEDFRESFFQKYQIYPSLNAHLGYELMSWLSSTMNSSSGFDFRKSLDQKSGVGGKITYGLDFRGSKNNRYVPILHLGDGVLDIK
ncbi:ABC transporter substrate-binding protein [Belliella kenyensis]|uniref:ABC transporter substrate-binding protein n=1 Tax=Belliella kenyensis TaxID=1472724 RepID=A0ABV8EGY5_9BACT|nr:ABC transporter substrate-binding protein [Belliella kenyensis]MCH7403091.1 ABC transporter substrate-binding protein [Belliella kenyensis]MDN3602260.1 ABC transporter substrate-binding protein [Belliella kenyensis]